MYKKGVLMNVEDLVDWLNKNKSIELISILPFSQSGFIHVIYWEEEPQPQKEEQRIEIHFDFMNVKDQNWGGIEKYLQRFTTQKPISKEKYQSIKQAIEQVLNDEPMVVAVSEFNDAYEFEIANVLSKCIIRINGKKYLEKEQVDSMCEDAFWKGREAYSTTSFYKYPNYQDYKNSKQKQ